MECEKECNNFVICRFSDEGKQKKHCNFFLPKNDNNDQIAEDLYIKNYKGFSATSVVDAHKKGFISGVNSANRRAAELQEKLEQLKQHAVCDCEGCRAIDNIEL